MRIGYDEEGAQIICEECHGTGKMTCKKCGGTREIDCPTCS